MNPITGSLKFLASNVFNALIALVFFIIASRYVSPAFIGKVAIIQLLELVISAFFSIIPSSLITREISYSLGKGHRYDNLTSTSLIYAILISPIFLLLYLFFHSYNYLWLSIPYLSLFFYSVYQGAILTGLGKFTETNVGYVIFILIRWGLSVLAILHDNIVLLILIWTLGALARTIYYQFYIPFKWHFDKNVFKEILKIGFPLYLSGVLGFIITQGERVVTAYLLGSYWLGIYQFMALMSTVPNMVVGSIASVLLPTSTYYYAKGTELKEIVSITIRLTTLLSVPLAIFAYAISPFVISTLFPSYEPGLLTLQVLTLFFTATNPLGTLGNFLIVSKKDLRPFIIIGLIEAIQLILLSYFLIPKMSILGAALAQVIDRIIGGLIGLYFLAKQEIFEFNKENLFTILLMGLASVAFISWIIALILSLLGIKFLGILKKKDIEVLERFTPKHIKGFVKILNLFSSTR